ncbi:MAG: PqqD family peptide modification chaperone, partial [Candidatus Dadabacteria bacterium]|nr:PqqD family peptide modification chaperone [Candidatus Dadabacteria bacterium]
MKNLLNKNIKVMEDVLSQQVGGETVMLDLNGENYFGLDTVGTRILELIREYGDLDKIYETLLDEYDVESEQLKN